LIGLDYGVVLELCRLYDVGNKKALLEDLQIMEAEALRLIVEEAERQQKAAKRKRSR
jgi:hypothetical protein